MPPAYRRSLIAMAVLPHPIGHRLRRLKNQIAHCRSNCHNDLMIAQAEIRQLPLPEKLALLEAVWTEISADPDSVEVPQWHKDILDERQSLLDQGSLQVLDWELAKAQINRIVR